MRHFGLINSFVFSFGVLLVGFALLTWLRVPVGTFGDWVFAFVAFVWLAAVVTVPWNVHFRAKAVLADAGPSRERGLPVDERQVAYVRKVAALSLGVAIALHVVSAVALFLLAYFGVSPVGYVGAALALLLTGLRPAASAYEYVADRLRDIGEAWRYPREDVVELRARVEAAESNVAEMMKQFDPENADALLSAHRRHVEATRSALADLAARVESARATNDAAHEKLSRESRSAIAQLSTDGQFLDHVREIIRFFKSA